MKKTFIFAFMLAVGVRGMAQGVDGNASLVSTGDIMSLPSMFSFDGKTSLIMFTGDVYDYVRPDEDANLIMYDDEMAPMLNFTPPKVENSLSYTVIDQREKLVIIYPDGYEDDRGFAGEWYQTRTDNGYALGMEFPEFYDLDQAIGGYESFKMPVTQTLFNNDEEYEYIQPIYEYREEKYENDRDDDGGIDYIMMDYLPSLVGFKIMTVTGEELQRVDLDTRFEYYGMSYILKINGKYYLALEGVFVDSECYTYIYKINRETSSIQQVGAPIKGMSVSPRTQGRGGSFTVELDGESNAEREVFVTDAAGRTVWRQTVPAGQKTVRISASRLGRGLNVVTVRGGKQGESCKVIVK